ncbi:Septum site-determining protein MinC [hydrothermal vent metagenome]|uniref:Septum site-determining protein MinC n=1 Tax=hydrothermal vent metagenome TaxID=652676 RepID=A0A3B0YAZ2_9ZZZZ
MAKDMTITASSCFELKGSMLTMIELHLLQSDSDQFSLQLDQKVRQAPDFFNHAPLVLDLTQIQSDSVIVDFADITHSIRHNNLSLVGVRNGNRAQHEAAKQHGLSILPESVEKTSNSTVNNSVQTKPPCTDSSDYQNLSKTITLPVRSGQQIYAKNCDLVILNTVSAGAEIIADGHIHVYGALRGRAIAGAHGNMNARIFCSDLEAELISIAGYYRAIEEMDESVRNQTVQIYLKDERLNIVKI